MKRGRKPYLRLAKDVDQVAEFPSHVWTIIIIYLPETKERMPDLGLMLCMMGTSKMMCDLFKGTVITMLRESLAVTTLCHPNSYYHRPMDKLSMYVAIFYNGIRHRVDLVPYLTACMKDTRYQTVQHLTNCVSLLELAVLETSYFTPILYIGHFNQFVYNYAPLHGARSNAYLQTVGHVSQLSDGVTPLTRMQNKTARGYTLSVCLQREYIASIYDSSSALISDEERVILLAFARKSIEMDRYEYRLDGDSVAISQHIKAALVDLFVTSGVTLKTQKLRGNHRFGDLILTSQSDGRQHHIYSEEARAFREACFENGVDNDRIDTFYLLHKFHERNWHAIANTDRFKPSSF